MNVVLIALPIAVLFVALLTLLIAFAIRFRPRVDDKPSDNKPRAAEPPTPRP